MRLYTQSRRGVSPLAGLALAAAVSMPLSVVAATPAAAEARTVTVNTGSGVLNVRSAPSANSPKIGAVDNQTRVVIVCHSRGEPFSGGPYRLTTTIWNRLDTGGFVTDAMLNTGSDDPVVPRCDGAPTAPPAPARATGTKTQKNPAEQGSPAWGALAKWYQVSGEQFYPALTGPPRDWPAAARAAGWTVVERPEPRSIVVFAPGADRAPAGGHVAWVDTTANRRDGQYIGITEVHSTGDGLISWSSRQVRDGAGMSYILLP